MTKASDMLREERSAGRASMLRAEGMRHRGLSSSDRRQVRLGEAHSCLGEGRETARRARRAKSGLAGAGSERGGIERLRSASAPLLTTVAPVVGYGTDTGGRDTVSDADDASREAVGSLRSAAVRAARAGKRASAAAKARGKARLQAPAGSVRAADRTGEGVPSDAPAALKPAARAGSAHSEGPAPAKRASDAAVARSTADRGPLARNRAARKAASAGRSRVQAPANPARASACATRRARTAQARAAWQARTRAEAARIAASSAARREAARSAGAAVRSLAPKAAAALLPLLACGLCLSLLLFLPASGCTAAVAGEDASWGTEGLSDNERAIMAYLRDKGLDQVHVAAIMGNMYQESNCRPEVEQVPGGAGGIGLCQWGHGVDGGRGDAMAAWAATLGKEWSDLYVQLDWLWAEMTNEGPAANQTSWYSAFSSGVQFERFKAYASVSDATSFWQHWIEAAGDARMEQRIAYANRYLAIFRSGSAVGSLPAGSVEAVIAEAKKHLGLPYVWGGTTPAGFDCSGFVKWCFEQNGFDLSGARTAQQLYNVATPVEAESAQAGDIVCFTYGAPNAGESMGHIGIYLGDGTMIHSGGYPEMVQISPTGPNGYYARFAQSTEVTE